MNTVRIFLSNNKYYDTLTSDTKERIMDSQEMYLKRAKRHLGKSAVVRKTKIIDVKIIDNG